MKKIFLIALALFLIHLVSATTATRSFSSSSVNVNQEAEIRINVNIEEGDDVYAVQENLPSGIEIVDAGEGSLFNRNLRWLKYSNVESIIYAYKVKFSSPGTYVFNGEYAFDNNNLQAITGDSVLVVSETGTGGNGGNGRGSSSGVAICTPSWVCSSWSSCINNEQTRECSDKNNCGVIFGKPAEKMLCSSAEEREELATPEKSLLIYFIISLIIIVFVIILILKRRKNL